MRILFLLVLLVAVSGCRASHSTIPSTSAKSDVEGRDAIDVRAATEAECENGGAVYSVYGDFNGNGARDDGEQVKNSQVVCNGLNGQNGEDGVNGADGEDGLDGSSVVFSVLPASAVACAAGGSTILMAQDSNHNSQFDSADSGIQSTSICNGLSPQLSPYTPVGILRPCGGRALYAETLLRLHDGQILASFSENNSGKNTRFSVLPDGSYATTDGANCSFTVATAGDGHSRSISWDGQVQEVWMIP